MDAHLSSFGTLKPGVIKIVLRHIEEVTQCPPEEGIFIHFEESDVKKLQALIIGPSDTPYEGGLFRFEITITNDFPFFPPLLKFLTTDNGRERMHPNLYDTGHVCLSTVNTWGHGWTPATTLKAVLLSIRSLLSKNALANEPGFEMNGRRQPASGQYEAYDKEKTFLTLRIAICDTVRDVLQLIDSKSEPFSKQMLRYFYDNYTRIKEIIEANKDNVYESNLRAHFLSSRTRIDYDSLRRDMEELYVKVKHLNFSTTLDLTAVEEIQGKNVAVDENSEEYITEGLDFFCLEDTSDFSDAEYEE